MQIHINKVQWVIAQQLIGYLTGELAHLETYATEKYNEATNQRHNALVVFIETLREIIPDKAPRV